MDPYAAQPYAPPPSSTQIQPQNPPTQDPYLYSQQYNQPQPYPYYPQQPSQAYPNAVYQQPPEQDPAAIHPPGVQVQPDPNQIPHYQYAYGQTNDPNAYYPQQPMSYSDPGVVQPGQQHQQPQQQQQWQNPGATGDYGLASIYPPNGQPQQYSGSGRSGGKPFRGGGSSFRGRGRGKGRGGKTTIGQPAKTPCMAWCELCRVDCNTLEILENHKNGKKHKKNLKIQEDLQKLAAKTQEAAQVTANTANPAPDGNKPEGQDGGLKRKARDGKSAEPSKKPKEIVPFICELCNVKCESAPTFDSHLKGRKHAFNLQVFQQQQATLGQAALQALYPALEALYPALLQALAQPNAIGGLDQQVLQWLQPFLPQPVLPVPPPVRAPENAATGGAQVGAEKQAGPVSKGDEVEAKPVEASGKVEASTKTEEAAK